MRVITLAFLLFLTLKLIGQTTYFPPISGDEWETINYEELNWCDENVQDLLAFHEENGTKAFIVLKDGKIVLEEYLNGFEANDAHQWNSAGKTITSFLVGLAQEQNLLNIEDKTSDHLGLGWTEMSPEQEEKITIWNQLTMTTGMDDLDEPFCTDPECLTYKADAGTRWAYHNSPYTLLDDVLRAASGRNLNTFTSQQLGNKIGFRGLWVPIDFNNIFFSNARSMARFGLLISNRGDWDGTTIMADKSYFDSMVNTSQNINNSYGYLWWLNGKENFRIPGLQFQFNGSLIPNAPDDSFSAIGLNGQFLTIIPSQNLVVLRMGDAPDNSFVPISFYDEMWGKIGNLACTVSSVKEQKTTPSEVFPNPFSDQIEFEEQYAKISVFNHLGQLIYEQNNANTLNTSSLNKGHYIFLFQKNNGKSQWARGVKN